MVHGSAGRANRRQRGSQGRGQNRADRELRFYAELSSGSGSGCAESGWAFPIHGGAGATWVEGGIAEGSGRNTGDRPRGTAVAELIVIERSLECVTSCLRRSRCRGWLS